MSQVRVEPEIEPRGGHLGSVVSYEGDCVNTNRIRFIGNWELFRTGQVIVFLDMETGFRIAGPVTVSTIDRYQHTIYLSTPVTVKRFAGIFISGVQDEASPPKI
jgi:hypothetical protein